MLVSVVQRFSFLADTALVVQIGELVDHCIEGSKLSGRNAQCRDTVRFIDAETFDFGSVATLLRERKEGTKTAEKTEVLGVVEIICRKIGEF